MQRKGIDFRAMLEGGTMVQIDKFSGFCGTLLNTVFNYTKKSFYKVSAHLYTRFYGLQPMKIQFKIKAFLFSQD
jgi:hypothetical protein